MVSKFSLLAWLGPSPDGIGSQQVGPGGLQAGGLVAIAGLVCVLLVLAALLRRALRGTSATTKLFAFSVSAGNALMDVAAIVQPDRPSVESLERELTAAKADAARSEVGDGRRPGPVPPPAANDGPYRSSP